MAKSKFAVVLDQHTPDTVIKDYIETGAAGEHAAPHQVIFCSSIDQGPSGLVRLELVEKSRNKTVAVFVPGRHIIVALEGTEEFQPGFGN